MAKKIRRRSDHCWNCGLQLNENVNYCPHCGQENTEKLVSVGFLIRDFFRQELSFDSKFWRSFRYFLFVPGYLTNEFSRGRRAAYISPVRLYLFISFIYFLTLSLNVYLQESTMVAGSEQVGTRKEETEKEKAAEANKKALERLERIEQRLKEQGDTAFAERLRLEREKSSGARPKTDEMDLHIGNTNFGDPKEFKESVERKGLKTTLDSLGIEHPFWRLVGHQLYKFQKRGQVGFVQKFIKDASIMMFFLLPIYALLLKLFFLRNRKYYIEHLIHSVHIHSFMFFILTLMALLSWFIDTVWLGWGSLIICTVYVGVSFRRVYRRRIRWVPLKVLFSGGSYLIVLSLGLLITLAISFLSL